MATPLKRTLVVIEDGVILTLSQNPQAVTDFPILRSAQAVAKSVSKCNTCGAAARRSRAFQAIKQAIAGLPTDKKRKLKTYLNAEKVRVIYRGSNNKVHELTF